MWFVRFCVFLAFFYSIPYNVTSILCFVAFGINYLQIGTKQWRYYDFGPKAVPPLICLPGTAGTADVYYKQIMALSMKVLHMLA